MDDNEKKATKKNGGIKKPTTKRYKKCWHWKKKPKKSGDKKTEKKITLKTE